MSTDPERLGQEDRPSDGIRAGARVLLQEAEAVRACGIALDDRFACAVQHLFECGGRVITCGIGKSGHIARKTAGTLSSTGTPSQFLHAAEAVHGDLGSVTSSDVVILYSHSGETDEIVRLFPSIRLAGAKSILITGRAKSSAGRLADVVLETLVTEEACSINLAPTTSTTVMLALSDALAIAVMERKGFGRDDFARFHPSGTLGKRLLLKVSDVMRGLEEISIVQPGADVPAVIRSMTESAVGVSCVMDAGALLGLISESDLRRQLLRDPRPMEGRASDMMNAEFTFVDPNLLAIEALEIFQNHPVKIGELPVLVEQQLHGLLVLKDLLRSGIV